MAPTKLFKRVFLSLAGLVGALLAVIVVLLVMGVSVDLHSLRGAVATTASAAIDRDVQINGPVMLHFSTTPRLEAGDVTIANLPQGRAERLLEAGHVGLSINLRSLLAGDIHLGEIRARDVTLNLESDVNGIGNWQSGIDGQSSAAGTGATEKDAGAESAAGPGKESGAKRSAGAIDPGIAGIDEIVLDNITLNYHDAAIDESLQLNLKQVKGTAGRDQAVQVDIEGSLQQQAFNLRLQSDALTDLRQGSTDWKLAMDGRFLETPLQVQGGIVTSAEQPGLLLESNLGRVDVGAMLAWLGVAKGMEAESEALEVKLLLVGDSLHELAEESTIQLKLHGGRIVVHDPKSEASFDIAALDGEFLMERGNPVTIRLNGQIRDEPVDIQIVGASLADYVSRSGDLPLMVELGIVESKLRLTSAVQLPLQESGMTLKVKFSGPSLDAFNDLLELKLPAFGPLQMEADMAFTSTGYDLSKMALSIGESQLEGSLSLDITRAKPVVSLSLISPLIQLSDFDVGEPLTDAQVAQQSTADSGEAATDKAKQAKTATSSAERAEKTEKLRNLLSYEVLGQLDANVHLEARQVLSGKDPLGAAHVRLTLDDAKLAIDPLQVEIPGGGIETSFSYQARPNDASMSLAADIEKLDLGILYRRAQPDTDRGGLLTLSAKLDATASDFDDMMANANGYLDFRLIPENVTAAVSDLWAVNLVSTVLKEVAEEDKSKINCVVVRLRMKEGVMREKAIYMDTSKMRIVGQADLDFRKRTLKLFMKPKAKKARLFSLTTPILVQGSFDDFGVRGVVLGLVSSAVSFITSPVHAPLRRIFTEKQPPDGLQACEEAWSRTGAESWTTGRMPPGDGESHTQ